MSVVTRFAPSPTGFLHIGGARTALFSWLHARRHGGRFILRVEDTDRDRSTEESTRAILDGMQWLGLDHDEGPYFQSERGERYREVLDDWLETGKAYYCYRTKEELDELREAQRARGEKPRYDGYWRDNDETPPEGVTPCIRFKNPLDGEVVFDDRIRGRVSVANAELDDLVICRSDGSPTYNFCVVVDDYDMGVTDVVRGDDHVSNTPRQINMLRALGVEPPSYAHVPMILGPDGKRLSKRHGAVSVMQYAEEGYLPEALMNYLVRLGWAHGDQEIFSREEMIEYFDLSDVNHSASTFNPEKLRWLNQQYLKSLEPDDIAWRLRYYFEQADIDPATGPHLADLVKAQRERSTTLVDLVESSRFLFQDFVEWDQKAVRKNLNSAATAPLEAVRAALADLPEADGWNAESIHGVITRVAEAQELKMGKVAQPIRVAVSGTAVSPPIDVTLEMLGRERTLYRIDRAIGLTREAA
ncbi:glutamate--tRNA ligase [Halofilum ochraceum]|uniref:glutamate--tRNA ligase n=1 Tax=Halofilum ochraceum TaxID=1611323 RepID=UPI0008372B6B|nr:glutamate--tRNA ligase [Halofilum ochraceum]